MTAVPFQRSCAADWFCTAAERAPISWQQGEYCMLVMHNSYNVMTFPSFLQFVSLYTRNYSLVINQGDNRCLFLVANSFVCFIIPLILSCLFSVCFFLDRFLDFNLTRHRKQDLITCPTEVCWLLPMDGLYTLRIPQEGEQRKMSRPEEGILTATRYRDIA